MRTNPSTLLCAPASAAALFLFLAAPLTVPAQSPEPDAGATTSPAAILGQVPRYRVAEGGELRPVNEPNPPAASAPSADAPAPVPPAPGFRSSTFGARTQPPQPAYGPATTKAPAVEPERPAMLPPTDERDPWATPFTQPPPADETPDRPKARARIEETKKPGLMRRITGRIPIVGPAIVGKPQPERDRDTPGPRRHQIADDILPDTDDDFAPPPPPGPMPVLLPPPGADVIRTTATVAAPTTFDPPPATAATPNYYAPAGPTAAPAQTPAYNAARPDPATAPPPMTGIMAPTPSLSATPIIIGPGEFGRTPATGTPAAPSVEVAPAAPTAPTEGIYIGTRPHSVSTPVVQSEPQPPAPMTATPPIVQTPAVVDADVAPSTPVAAPPVPAEAVATPFGATVPAAPPQPGTAPATNPAAALTSVTFEANDLGMPNPAVEPNDYVRGEFVGGVEKARTGDYPGAAEVFRAYAVSHSSSGLAPRALFLAVVFEPVPSKALGTFRSLRENHPRSPYIEELQRRRHPVTGMPEYLPADVERFRAELSQAAGDPGRVLDARRRLATALVALNQHDAAEPEIQLGLTDARGRPGEADFLDLLAEVQIARRDTRAAMETLTDLLQRFPYYRNRPKVRMNMGLVCEEAGFYPNALANYRYLIEESPEATEATFARERIRDLEQMAQ